MFSSAKDDPQKTFPDDDCIWRHENYSHAN